MVLIYYSVLLIFNQILVFCAKVYSYEIKCPDFSERNLRAKGFCKRHTPDRYACLYDVNAFIPIESCDRIADYSSPGEIYVIAGARTTAACSIDTYQPFALWANISSCCLYQKSKCNDEGQIPSSTDLGIADRSCQCDLKNGFHFVKQPKDPCNCFSFEEDCSCFYDPHKDIPRSSHACTTPAAYPKHPPSVSKGNTQVYFTDSPTFYVTQHKGKLLFYVILSMVFIMIVILLTVTFSLLIRKEKLVVAIDIGTTSSVYAYSISSSSSNIQLNKLWNTGVRGTYSQKTPTCILLSKEFKPIAIGYDAQKEYSDHIYEKEADEYVFVDKFKMELYDAKEISDDFSINDINGHPVPAIQVFSNMFILLKKRLESELQYINRSVLNHNIQWVLTIPAAWTERAETLIKTCADMAGIPNYNLMIVVESESASVYIHHLLRNRKLDISLTKLPKKYLVIDLGGGTDDITAHKVSQYGKLKEICKPSGSCHGGKEVDTKILFCLEEIVHTNVVKSLKTQVHFLELLDEFENINSLITSSKTKKQLTCKFPINLLNKLCKEYHGKEFQEMLQSSKYSEKFRLINDRLRIDRELIADFISDVASNIVKDIRYTLKKVKTHEIRHEHDEAIRTFIVVGGFSKSQIVRQTFRKAFPTFRIIYPLNEDADLAVVKGAVLYGQDPHYIKSCKKTANLF